jgi:Rps23 Pro-64 3,4-dihydroxylase Tpa1-like proline 4-hydroxylase
MKKVTKYIDFLPFDLLNELQEFANKVNQMDVNSVDGFKTNKTDWEDDIVQESEPLKIYTVEADEDNELINRIKTEIRNQTGWKTDGPIMLYFWPPGSYIPWHDDGHMNAGFTLYLNDFWDRDWGGLFLYEYGPENNIVGLTPKENIAVLQEGGVYHAITTINKGSNVRITLQAFFLEKIEE